MVEPERLTFRPIQHSDIPFLYRVYASTRAEEMALVNWSPAEKQVFLEMQFNAQHTYYQEHFPQATYDIVLLDGEPIGRLYLDRRPNELGIIDIALLPAYRGQGIGTFLLAQTLDEAQTAGAPVRIYVEHNNPALRLYHRLGFKIIGDQGVYYHLERQPV